MDLPVVMSHVSVGTTDMARALRFYDAVFATIGAKRVLEEGSFAVAYGKRFPEFWVQYPHDRQPHAAGNGQHFGFHAGSRDAVHAFYVAALANGGTDDGEPGHRELYGPEYYGCFVRDPDGNKIEAMIWEGPPLG
jgi:catechol 2,3-dioxygenase-like lactoylglutathione lyase family enzyme